MSVADDALFSFDQAIVTGGMVSPDSFTLATPATSGTYIIQVTILSSTSGPANFFKVDLQVNAVTQAVLLSSVAASSFPMLLTGTYILANATNANITIKNTTGATVSLIAATDINVSLTEFGKLLNPNLFYFH